MEEKTYKLMGNTGAINITFGVVSIIAGVAAGVILIVSGAKLLSNMLQPAALRAGEHGCIHLFSILRFHISKN